MRVLGDLGICLVSIGASATARLAFETVIDSNTSFLVRTNAVLELMDLESSVQNRVAFERRRGQAEDARDRMTPSMSCDYHFKAGVGMARFGRVKRAKEYLTAGLRIAEEHRLNAWYFRLEKELNTLEAQVASAGTEAREPELALPIKQNEWPGVEEVAVGLREYALMKD